MREKDKNILIRDIPDDVVRALDVRAADAGQSRQEYIAALLTNHVKSDPARRLTLAWIRADRPGEVDDAECIDCGQPVALDGMWFAVQSDGTLAGPYCEFDATNE